jgi:hypothetical protein
MIGHVWLRSWAVIKTHGVHFELQPLGAVTENVFVNAMECRGLARFGLERYWVRDVSNLTYSKHEGVSDSFVKEGSAGFRGVRRFSVDVWWVSRVVRWPNANTNTFLITSGDLKFGVGNKGIKSFIPPDEEPGVVDEFEG